MLVGTFTFESKDESRAAEFVMRWNLFPEELIGIGAKDRICLVSLAHPIGYGSTKLVDAESVSAGGWGI